MRKTPTKRINLYVCFTVDIPEEETEIDELFIDLPNNGLDVRVCKWENGKLIEYPVHETLKYDTVDKEVY